MTVEYIVKYGNVSINTYNKVLAIKLARKTNGTIYKSVKKDNAKGVDVKAWCLYVAAAAKITKICGSDVGKFVQIAYWFLSLREPLLRAEFHYTTHSDICQ